MIGRKVRELRAERGWTQQQLAAASGLCQMTISNWEHDGRMPAFDGVVRVARALGVSSEVFAALVPHGHTPPRA